MPIKIRPILDLPDTFWGGGNLIQPSFYRGPTTKWHNPVPSPQRHRSSNRPWMNHLSSGCDGNKLGSSPCLLPHPHPPLPLFPSLVVGKGPPSTPISSASQRGAVKENGMNVWLGPGILHVYDLTWEFLIPACNFVGLPLWKWGKPIPTAFSQIYSRSLARE